MKNSKNISLRLLLEYNNISEQDWKRKIVETIRSDLFHVVQSARSLSSRVSSVNGLFVEKEENIYPLTIEGGKIFRFRENREGHATPRAKEEKYKNNKKGGEEIGGRSEEGGKRWNIF